MRALPYLCLSLLFAFLAACGDDSGTSPDASGGDDDPDAQVEPPDAAPPPDAEENSTDPAAVCAELCVTLNACFGGEEGGGPNQDCLDGCGEDLADCTPEEVGTIDGCGSVGCRQIVDCITAVACIDTGGKGSVCGDGTCDPDEDCSFCADDCGACVCGDATCSPGECATCAGDCPGGCVCPHDTCTAGEALDPGCDPCAVQVCETDSFCCTTSWDEACVGEANSICGKDCPIDPPPPPVDGGVPEIDAAP